MVSKRKTAKYMPKKVTPQVANVASIGKEPLVLPNYSGVQYHPQTTGLFLKKNVENDTDDILRLASNQSDDAGELIKLKYKDTTTPDAKAIIAFEDENNDSKAWLVTHDYLTYPSDQHKHFSIEVSDDAGALQSRFTIPYDNDIAEMTINQANLTLHRNSGEINGNITFGGLGGGGNIRHNNAMTIYPQAQTTRGLKIDDDGSNIEISALGTDTIEILDDVDVTGNITVDSSLSITGGSIATTSGELIILSQSGTVDFDNEHLTTTGKGTFGEVDVDTLNLNGNTISDSTGTISFDNDNITTTGQITTPIIETSATNATLNIQPDAIDTTSAVNFFGNAATTDRPIVTIWGYRDSGATTGQVGMKMYIDTWGRATFEQTGAGALGYMFLDNIWMGSDTDYLIYGNGGRTWNGMNTGQTKMPTIIGMSDVSDAGRNLIIGGNSERSTNFALAAPTGCAVYITGGNSQTTEYLKLEHDRTDGTITTGTGDLNLTASSEITIGDGGTTNYTEFSNTGDQVFVGSAGLPYAEISATGNSTETVIASAGTAVQVTIFDTDGASNNATPDHTNDHITITKAGHYMINVSATINSVAGASSKFEISVQKNNGASEIIPHMDRNIAGGAGAAGVVSLSGIADLAVNDTVEVWIENETNTQNYVVEDIDLAIFQLGGT